MSTDEHITAERVAEVRASFDRIEQPLEDLFADRRNAREDAGMPCVLFRWFYTTRLFVL